MYRRTLSLVCLAGVGVALGACAARPARPPTIAPTPVAGEVAGRPRLGSPIALNDSSTILVPYTLET